MAKRRTSTGAAGTADDLISSYIKDCNDRGTTSGAYLASEHAERTWGLLLKHIAVQYLIGGSNRLPMGRFLGVSGERGSMKSTLIQEIGNWVVLDDEAPTGGVHFPVDTENKTSPEMLASLARGKAGSDDGARAILRRKPFVYSETMEDWMTESTDIIERVKAMASKPPGERIPAMLSIDSLMARSTADQQEKVAKEGHAEARGYPVGNMMLTNYLESVSLANAPLIFAYVQHMKQDVGAQGYGIQYREKGAVAAAFAASIHLRVKKASATPIRLASHPAQLFEGPTVEGYTLQLQAHKSCVGPDRRKLLVDLIWQYHDEEVEVEGETKVQSLQYMKYDWAGALGQLLFEQKYGDKKLHEFGIKRMNDYLYFTATGKKINCEELELKGASLTEFGAAIEANPEITARVQTLLGIRSYPSYQTVTFNDG